MIQNAANGQNWMFRNLFVEDGGQVKDILNDGRWSCAVFVSSILYLNKLIKDVHANVDSTVRDMIASGWHEIKDLRSGAVIVWKKKSAQDDGQMHGHIGFFVGNDMAISNDSGGTGFPREHDPTFNGTREVDKILWHPDLDIE